MKKALGTLRNYWQGMQIYLRGGVRLIRPLVEDAPSRNVSEAIRVLFQSYIVERRPNITISYLRDSTTDGDDDPEEEGHTPTHSVAHPMLKYGAIVADDFYEQLEAVRNQHDPHLYACAANLREANFKEQMKDVAPMGFRCKKRPAECGGYGRQFTSYEP